MQKALVCSLAVLFLFLLSSPTLLAQNMIEFESPTMGITLSYPSTWSPITKISNQSLDSMSMGDRFLHEFRVNTTGKEQCSESASTRDRCYISWDNYDNPNETNYTKDHSWSFSLAAIPIEDEEISEKCQCSTLLDYMRYRYRMLNVPVPLVKSNFTFINDNQTTIGKNYSAWQMEFAEKSSDPESYSKTLHVYTKVNNTFYQFSYDTGSEALYSNHLPEIKNVLSSIQISPIQQVVAKAPSFISPEEAVEINKNRDESMKNFEDEFLSIISNDTEKSSAMADNGGSANSLEILSHNSYIDSAGMMHVVGEVKNNSPFVAEFAKITATFYDANKKVVGTDFAYTNPTNIPVESTVPFEIILLSASIPIDQIDSYKLTSSIG